ncbi:MAG: hypothetical protein ACREOJ_02775 [Gemmatimonadaceae bacterium]
MTDDQFEQFLQREARRYNDPPPTPRDEMWARIGAERRDGRTTPVRSITIRRLWWTAGFAMAAALVLGVGIGYSLRGSAAPGHIAQQMSRVPAPATISQPGALYIAITTEHLARAEALLTSFRTESEHGTVDPQITEWAGDLLGTTRLLLDSPDATDPRLHKLLGDLELVLTQITQLGAEQHAAPGSVRNELNLIDQSLRDRDMMTRIRSATPSGTGTALQTGT